MTCRCSLRAPLNWIASGIPSGAVAHSQRSEIRQLSHALSAGTVEFAAALVDSLPEDYPQTRQWAQAAYLQQPTAQGTDYGSRRHDAADV